MGDEPAKTEEPAEFLSKQVKPGNKTSEFKMTYVMVIVAALVGAVLELGLPESHWAVKIALILAPVLGAFGYSVSRGMAKKVVIFFLIPATLIGMAGCCKGHIPVSEIKDPVKLITERHDRFVKGEATESDKDEKKKATYLRTSELLRLQLEEAAKK